MAVVGRSQHATFPWNDRAPSAGSRWVLVAQRVAAIDPWSLLDATSEDALVLWRSATHFDIALGVAAQARASGPGRFETLRVAATALLDDVDPGPAGSSPRLFGGFGLGDEDGELPAASFVLPRWWWSCRGGVTTLTVAADRREDPRHLVEAAPSTAGWLPAARAQVCDIAAPESAGWRDEVETVLAAIARGEISKLVCVRPTAVTLTRPLEVGQFLGGLQAPRALRFVVRRDGCSFFGASPERLVALEDGKIATEAIAGTAPACPDPAGELLASSKEREEHQIVVEAITAALAEISDATVCSPEPELLDLGRLVHLRTRIAARTRRPIHLLEVAERLHPTPAVAGAPKAQALRKLAALGRRGGWYTGAVGWFDRAGHGDLQVALRCGLTAATRLELWAGAGIVAGAEASREHREIALKTSTMLAPLIGTDPAEVATHVCEESP